MTATKSAVAAMALGLGFMVAPSAHATIFTSESAFDSAATTAGIALSTDNFSTYAQQNIAVGQTLGSFKYTFDPNLSDAAGTFPTIGTDGGVNVLIGGPGSQGFVGGNSVTLTFVGTNKLLAFGAFFTYAPNFEDLLAGLYNLTIVDGTAANTTVGNPAGLTAAGSEFFLGFIGAAGQDFTAATLSSVLNTSDGSFPPAYEINQLDFGEGTVANPGAGGGAVPEPASLAMLLSGLGLAGAFRRRRAKR